MQLDQPKDQYNQRTYEMNPKLNLKMRKNISFTIGSQSLLDLYRCSTSVEHFKVN